MSTRSTQMLLFWRQTFRSGSYRQKQMNNATIILHLLPVTFVLMKLVKAFHALSWRGLLLILRMYLYVHRWRYERSTAGKTSVKFFNGAEQVEGKPSEPQRFCGGKQTIPSPTHGPSACGGTIPLFPMTILSFVILLQKGNECHTWIL